MVFKCKMCGGDIEVIDSSNIGKCLYCKSTMTLPNLDNEKILNLYNRANSLRLANEFDKAYSVYETILEIDNEQVEAHWGLILCKYGVEYVDDPKTKEKIPTCHRTITNSILKDNDYQFVTKKSYGDALKLYEKEAKAINEIQKQILDISSKESPYDIFICYKETNKDNERTHDSVMAEDIYNALTKEGYKVFFARITLEDKLGKEYEPYIFSALTSAKVMLVVGTNEENFEAVWVKNEWSRYLAFMKTDKSKTLVPVYSKIDAYKLPEEFAMLQAQNMDKVGAMQDLIRGVKKIIDSSKSKKEVDEDVLKKVKAALDEESSIGNDKYEVTEVKEKLPVWYYVFILCVTGAFLLGKMGSAFQGFIINWSSNRLSFGFMEITPILTVIQIIAAILVFVAMVMKISSRKTYEKANYLYFIALILEVISALICINYSSIVYYGWLGCAGAEFILYLVNPKWHLDASSKVIVNREEKNKLQEKNKNIRENFTQKSKYAISLKWFFISAVICIIIYAIYGYIVYTSPKDNGRDESVSQIRITADYLNFRREMDFSDYNIYSELHKDEIYTILDTELDGGDSTACFVWYKIKNRFGVTGYACGADDSYVYVEPLLTPTAKEELLKPSNARVPSQKQIEVVSEYLNIRDEESRYSNILTTVTKGNIFTVYNETINYDGGWYQIKTSDGITGWVSNEYVKVLK